MLSTVFHSPSKPNIHFFLCAKKGMRDLSKKLYDSFTGSELKRALYSASLKDRL